MSDYERRVNDRDIKAYVEMDNQIVSNIPGIKNNNVDIQEKYIDKLFSNSGSTNNVSGYSPIRSHS
jgi:hypothetical protein